MGRRRSKRTGKTDIRSQIEHIISEANAQTNPLSSLPPAFLTVDLPASTNNTTLSTSTAKSTAATTTTTAPPQSQPPLQTPLQSTQCSKTSQTTQTHSTIIQFYKSPLPNDIHNSCLDLFQQNMGEMYRQSSWGLDLDEKSQELGHEDARFLIVLAPSSPSFPSSTSSPSEADDNIGIDKNDHSEAEQGKPPPQPQQQLSQKVLGFAHYRHEFNDDSHPTEPITYLYELQIHPTLQSQGLGKRLMSLVELLSLKAHMRKVMLTVFRTNGAAMGFYLKKMKYGIDGCSPSNYGGEENEGCDYEILSKALG